MLDLNDATAIHAADSRRWLEQILKLPQLLEEGWTAASTFELPASYAQIDRVVIAGAGDTIEYGALFAALVSAECPVPIHLVADYDLPAFARQARTLVIALSAARAAEETAALIEQAQARGCQLLALSQALPVQGYAVIGALLNIATRLQWTHDFAADLAEAVEITRAWSSAFAAESPVAQNLAKRQAGQLMGRLVVVYGAGHLAEVARAWKNRFNVAAKAWAASEAVPMANYTALLGVDWPADFARQVAPLFLLSASDQPRNAQRLALTQRAFMLHGCNTDLIRARGRSPLAQAMSLVLLGDCMSYYLALLYGADPAQTDAIAEFHADLF